MNEPRPFPRSLLWFLLPLLCFPLLAVPVVGIVGFYLLTMTPLLTIAINAGFVSLGIEALSGQISRQWLAAPAIWFCGYLALAAASNMEVARIDAQFRSANTATKIAFDPAREDLVVFGKLSARTMIRTLDVPVVFEARPGREPGYTAYRLGGRDTCLKLRNDAALRSLTDDYQQVRTDELGPAKYHDDICIYALPESPTKPIVKITGSGKRPVDSLLAPRLETSTAILASSGQTQVLQFSLASELGWIPRPTPGRVTLFTVPKGPPFQRERERNIGGETYETIGRALGLKSAREAERRAAVNARPDTHAMAAFANETKARLLLLEHMMVDPGSFKVPADGVRVARLAEQPEVIAPLARRIVDAAVKALDLGADDVTDRRGWYATVVLQNLVAALPTKEFDREGRRLANLLFQRANGSAEPLSKLLVRRLHDFGPDFYPIVGKLSARYKETW